MQREIKMGALGYDMDTGKIVRWLKRVGEPVVRGEPILEVETEKTTIEMEALHSGTLVEIVHGVGAEVAVGEVVGYLEAPE
jgi:pyruvate/2-oxoglutarate dehydrogenase complex dihydrolipoamide acyltransferase (E2) component